MSLNGQTHFKNLAAKFLSVSDHFITLRIKGLRSEIQQCFRVVAGFLNAIPHLIAKAITLDKFLTYFHLGVTKETLSRLFWNLANFTNPTSLLIKSPSSHVLFGAKEYLKWMGKFSKEA